MISIVEGDAGTD